MRRAVRAGFASLIAVREMNGSVHAYRITELAPEFPAAVAAAHRNGRAPTALRRRRKRANRERGERYRAGREGHCQGCFARFYGTGEPYRLPGPRTSLAERHKSDYFQQHQAAAPTRRTVKLFPADVFIHPSRPATASRSQGTPACAGACRTPDDSPPTISRLRKPPGRRKRSAPMTRPMSRALPPVNCRRTKSTASLSPGARRWSSARGGTKTRAAFTPPRCSPPRIFSASIPA